MICPSVRRKELQVSHRVHYHCFVHSVYLVAYSKLMRFRLSSTHWHYLVKPRRGDALLFFSLHPTAIPDPSSLHAGCPVLEGEKWSATKWIHVDSFDKNLAAGGNCTDQNDSCGRWAALGECTKNPEYMIGSAELPGYCRRSCKVC